MYYILVEFVQCSLTLGIRNCGCGVKNKLLFMRNIRFMSDCYITAILFSSLYHMDMETELYRKAHTRFDLMLILIVVVVVSPFSIVFVLSVWGEWKRHHLFEMWLLTTSALVAEP